MPFQHEQQFLNAMSQGTAVPKQDSTDAPWTLLEPQLRCPKCGQHLTGLADTQAVVTPDKKKGLSQLSVTVYSNPEAQPVAWRVAPCGHEVSAEWAGAYTAEVQRRKEGWTPTSLPSPFQKQEQALLESKLAEAHDRLSTLRNAFGKPGMFFTPAVSVAQILAAEKEVIQLYDRLLRVGRAPMQLGPSRWYSDEAITWAQGKGLALPPMSEPIGGFVQDGPKAAGYLNKPVNPSQVAKQKGLAPGWAGKPAQLQTLPEGAIPAVSSPTQSPLVPDQALAQTSSNLPLERLRRRHRRKISKIPSKKSEEGE